MKEDITLCFDQYRLQLLTPQHADLFYRLVSENRSRLEDFFAGTVARTKTAGDTLAYLTTLSERAVEGSFYPYGIFDGSTGMLVGYVHVFNIDPKIPKAEIGFFTDVTHTRKGICEKAVKLISDHYFHQLAYNKLFLRTHPGNTPARQLAEKCGFEKEGLIRHDYKTSSGQLVDLLYYGRCKNC